VKILPYGHTHVTAFSNTTFQGGESVLGECGSNRFLDEDQQFTPAPE